jgi:hypothetical protein
MSSMRIQHVDATTVHPEVRTWVFTQRRSSTTVPSIGKWHSESGNTVGAGRRLLDRAFARCLKNPTIPTPDGVATRKKLTLNQVGTSTATCTAYPRPTTTATAITAEGREHMPPPQSHHCPLDKRHHREALDQRHRRGQPHYHGHHQTLLFGLYTTVMSTLLFPCNECLLCMNTIQWSTRTVLSIF